VFGASADRQRERSRGRQPHCSEGMHQSDALHRSAAMSARSPAPKGGKR